MRLQHILAATDESDAGRAAVRAAVGLAFGCSARVTVLRVLPFQAAPRFAGVADGSGVMETADGDPEGTRLLRWLEADVLSQDEVARVDLGVAFGIPGVEICRYADRNQADLVVLGRKRHSPMMRLLLGDTADAVARRSRVPNLFVQEGWRGLNTLLAALDGSDRGMLVLREASEFASQIGARLHTITVERAPAGESSPLAPTLPLTRSSSLQDQVGVLLGKAGLPPVPLTVRQGDVVERIIAEVQDTEVDTLAVGYHRGGAPGVLEAGSTARRLAHLAPCAVLTIPL